MRAALWRGTPGHPLVRRRAPDGRAGASATLYSDGAVAQVEDVGTAAAAARPRPRPRGRERRGRRGASPPGTSSSSSSADADDWPRELYAKLGFREIGRGWACQREAPAAT